MSDEELIKQIQIELEKQIEHCERDNGNQYDVCQIQLSFHKKLLNLIKARGLKGE